MESSYKFAEWYIEAKNKRGFKEKFEFHGSEKKYEYSLDCNKDFMVLKRIDNSSGSNETENTEKNLKKAEMEEDSSEHDFKFHINVKSDEDIGRAWEIAAKICCEQGLSGMKVMLNRPKCPEEIINQNSEISEIYLSHCKPITIYTMPSIKAEIYIKIFEEIELSLRNKNIEPGQLPPLDGRLNTERCQNFQYISFRIENEGRGRENFYLPAAESLFEKWYVEQDLYVDPKWFSGNTKYEGGKEFVLKDCAGRTLAHYAAESNNMRCLKKLKEANFNGFNEQDESGDAPLHLAASRNHLEIVKLLIEYKGELNIENKLGKTPLYYAKGDVEIFLSDKGGKLGSKEKSSSSASSTTSSSSSTSSSTSSSSSEDSDESSEVKKIPNKNLSFSVGFFKLKLNVPIESKQNDNNNELLETIQKIVPEQKWELNNEGSVYLLMSQKNVEELEEHFKENKFFSYIVMKSISEKIEETHILVIKKEALEELKKVPPKKFSENNFNY